MKNISPNNNFNQGTVRLHVEPTLIPLIKINSDEISDKDCVKIKLCRYPMTQNLDRYEFQMDLFDNSDLEEFFLIIRNSNTTLESSVRILASANIKYFYMLVCGYALRQFYTLSAEVGITTQTTWNSLFWVWVRTFSCYCDIKTKVRDAPRNEQAVLFKIKMLRWSYDWY